MQAVSNPRHGEILAGDIRYLLIRPDVLMGIAKHSEDDFFSAFEASAFANAKASFQAYRDSGRFGTEDFLQSCCTVAAELGWGVWTADPAAGQIRTVHVANSPFAAGHGPADRPVCSPITGVLRAIALVGYGEEWTVHETSCVAQGKAQCCFRLAAASASR